MVPAVTPFGLPWRRTGQSAAARARVFRVQFFATGEISPVFKQARTCGFMALTEGPELALFGGDVQQVTMR